jgi:hypothetical protein
MLRVEGERGSSSTEWRQQQAAKKRMEVRNIMKKAGRLNLPAGLDRLKPAPPFCLEP